MEEEGFKARVYSVPVAGLPKFMGIPGENATAYYPQMST